MSATWEHAYLGMKALATTPGNLPARIKAAWLDLAVCAVYIDEIEEPQRTRFKEMLHRVREAEPRYESERLGPIDWYLMRCQGRNLVTFAEELFDFAYAMLEIGLQPSSDEP
jgi:hypothetical protein